MAVAEKSRGVDVFIGHGARCVLSTLWNVDDRVARDFGIEFVRRWMSGTIAGVNRPGESGEPPETPGRFREAYDLTLRDLATRLPHDLRAPSTQDAFQLIGDRHLVWPIGFPA